MTSKMDRLFGSKTRVALLSKIMMNPDKRFYIRELSKDLGIPYGLLYREEKNLSALGIINEEKKGKVTLLSVNKDLPYFDELKGLIKKTVGLGDLLRDALSKLEGIRYALVYGSFATGEETGSSDIDLLIVGRVPEEKVLNVVSRLEEMIDQEINYILWNENEFKNKVKDRHHLLLDITSKPVIMLIGEEDEFRRAAKK